MIHSKNKPGTKLLFQCFTVIFFVLAAQSDLTLSEAALVTQTVGYRRNLLTLMQRTGDLLQERGIVVQ